NLFIDFFAESRGSKRQAQHTTGTGPEGRMPKSKVCI
ncbi:MAG: hypothetical protein ACI9RZ_001939, partial [Sphingobacteriales bacterium]